MRGRPRDVRLAGGAGAGIGTALPHAFQAEGVATLLTAAASSAIVAGILAFALAARNE